MKKTVLFCNLCKAKRTSFFAAMALVFLACSNQNEIVPSQVVTFHVQTFDQSQEPMNGPRKAPQASIYEDEGDSITDIFIFDGNTQVAHQTSEAENFGTVTLPLTHGEHNLHFVATGSEGITYDWDYSEYAYFLNTTLLRSTFGKHLTINVTTTIDDQDITLDRLTGILQITILDEFPSNAAEIEFIVKRRYTALRVSDFLGNYTTSSDTIRASCASLTGLSNQEFNIYILSRYYNEPYSATITINAYNAEGDNIASASATSVQLCSNTKTKLSGKLFNLPVANISLSTEWNEDIIMPF